MKSNKIKKAEFQNILVILLVVLVLVLLVVNFREGFGGVYSLGDLSIKRKYDALSRAIEPLFVSWFIVLVVVVYKVIYYLKKK